MSERYCSAVVVAGVLVAAGIVAWFMLAHTKSAPAETAVSVSSGTRQPAPSNTASIARDSSEPETPPEQLDADPRPEEAATKVIVYYFHRTTRCDACLAIEAYTEETIQRDFLDVLEEDRLEWLPVNIEEPGNEHFEDDFQLVTQSVVLVELTDGEMTRWKNLEQVWDLLDDEVVFQEYIAQEVWEFLGG